MVGGGLAPGPLNGSEAGPLLRPLGSREAVPSEPSQALSVSQQVPMSKEARGAYDRLGAQSLWQLQWGGALNAEVLRALSLRKRFLPP